MKDNFNNEFFEEGMKDKGLNEIIKDMGSSNIYSKNNQKMKLEVLKEVFIGNPDLAKNVLEYMKFLGASNQKINEEVIEVHRETINKFICRLDSPNITEREIELIYESIKDLSEKIESARRDYSELTKRVLVGIGTVAMAVVTVFVTGQNRNYTKKDYLEENKEYR